MNLHINEITRHVLQEIEVIVSNSEKMICQPDDPSGLYTEYVIDNEKFRENLQKRIDELQSL